MDKFEKIKSLYKKSSFNKNGYNVKIDLRTKDRFIKSLELYTDYDSLDDKDEEIKDVKKFF